MTLVSPYLIRVEILYVRCIDGGDPKELEDFSHHLMDRCELLR